MTDPRSPDSPALTGTPDGPAVPSVIVQDLHVSYRTFGGRRRQDEDAGRLLRLVGRTRDHVGAVTHVQAVRGVSFIAYEGESVGIIGRNGSGKSTLLRAMAGLIPLDSGQVWARGEIALLGVNAALMASLSGERNIMLGGLAQGLTRKQVRAMRDEIVDFAGIPDEFLHMPMRSYSSGMAARLRFAISSTRTPDVLIIDEALATGDAEFRTRSAERVEQIRRQAGTVFLVTHSTSQIRKMCDRAIWIEKGVVKADGPAKKVTDRYEEFVEQRRQRRAERRKG